MRQRKIRYLIAAWLLFLLIASAIAPAQTSRRKGTSHIKNRPAAEAKTPIDAETWRRNPPPPAPATPLKLPALRQIQLDNGLTIILIESQRIPVVSISLGIPVGDVNDPPEVIGLAEATAGLLTDGAGSRSSEQLARDVESLGGQIVAGSNDDYTEISASVITENTAALLDIFADVVLRPTFPENEIALYKKNREQNCEVQRQDPAFLASEQLHKTLYGEHPYAISAPTPASIAAIDRAKIETFYKANYNPQGAVLVVNGQFDAATMEAKLRALFGNWKSAPGKESHFPAPPIGKGRRVILVDRPDSEQADFRIGNLGVARADADFFPLLVANAILGDGTSSRLFLNIREKKGYTYDVSSSVVAPRMRGLFYGSSETRNEVTGAAIKEILAEFERMRTQPVSESDLRNAKNYLTGNFSLTLSTQGGISGSILRSRMLNLPANFLETYRQSVEAVTAEQVQQAAQKYIPTADAVIVVVGDAKKIKAQLAPFGKLELFDINGNPMP